MSNALIDTVQETCSLPFGLYFRQLLQPSIQPVMAQTTSEPEITTGDGSDPDKIDSHWIPDEDEERLQRGAFNAVHTTTVPATPG